MVIGGIALLATGAVACSDDSDGDPSTEGGRGGSAGQSEAGAGAGAGMTGGGAGGSMAGRSGAGSGGASSGTGGGTGTVGDAGAADGGGGFTEMGVCGQRGEATVNATEFAGFEEFYIISEEGFGEDICVVRFDVARVGEAPAGCMDADVDCLWAHTVEFSNPSVVLDEGGVCSNSELGLDADAIAEIDGSRASYGFVSEVVGHANVMMKYDETMATWDAYGNGSYDEAEESFDFDRRDGLCDY
jgi:hypothetical protein